MTHLDGQEVLERGTPSLVENAGADAKGSRPFPAELDPVNTRIADLAEVG
jgi:hypothetical protein